MRLLDYSDLEAKGIRYSRAQIWRKVKDGSFPRPVKVGANRNAWLESEIDRWIESLIAARDSDETEAA